MPITLAQRLASRYRDVQHLLKRWVSYDQVVAIHSRQLRRFGGAPGLRDDGILRSALEPPLSKWRYEAADLACLAAAYAFGLAKDQAFEDGNKGVAFMTMVVFLRTTDVRFAPDRAHATAIMISLAAGEVSEQSLTRWIRDNWPPPPYPPQHAGEGREGATPQRRTSIR